MEPLVRTSGDRPRGTIVKGLFARCSLMEAIRGE